MKMIFSLIIACLVIPVCSHASAKQKPSFYERSMAAISTPGLRRSGAANAPVQQALFTGIYDEQGADPRFRKSPWYKGGGEAADPRKVGIGLTIAGSIVTLLGGGIIYYASQLRDYTANGVDHRVYPTGYYMIGVLVAGGGLGMLIPGIVKLTRER